MLLLVALAWLSGCSVGIGRDCEVDSDCSTAQVCANERCTRTCTKDEDCIRPTYACRPLDDPEREPSVNVCVTTDAGGQGDLAGGCTSDRQCREKLGSRGKCGIDGRCIVAETQYGLLVRDRTEIAGETGVASRRGAEIGAAYLADENGAPTAYAETLDYRPGAGLGGESHLTGQKPELSGDRQCVAPPLEEHTTPLGGGDLLVEFVDDAERSVAIEPGRRVVVIEWAQPNCGDSETDRDTYDVYLCESTSGSVTLEDCNRRVVESASGRTTVVPRPDEQTDGGSSDAGVEADDQRDTGH